MSYNQKFLDRHAVKAAFAPVDLNAAAVVGERVSLANAQKVTVVITLADAASGAVTDITLKQHNAASAGVTKDLSVANPYFKKVGAASSFTKVEPASAAANYVLTSDFDQEPGQIVFEIEAQDLDRDNGFSHFSINLADSTVARIASAIYILGEMRTAPGHEASV